MKTAENKQTAESIPISKWKEDERPREKMMLLGPSALTDSELISVLLRSGSAKCSAVGLSRSLLSKVGNSLRELMKLSPDKLMSLSGIGRAKAASVMAAGELALRISAEPDAEKPYVRSSSAAAGILRPLLRNLSHEECWILYISTSGRLIGKEKISSGGVSSTVFDTRIIVKKSLEKLASSIILAHNHPSGNPFPGDADRRNTEALRDAVSFFDITLIDHIIIAGDKYYSFSDGRAF